jgi:cytochrome c553
VAAQDIEVGGNLYQKQCRQCHGPEAQGLSAYPALAGQTAEYLTDKLNRYRAGERIGPNTMLMAPNARNLSDEDIANIVGFITAIES